MLKELIARLLFLLDVGSVAYAMCLLFGNFRGYSYLELLLIVFCIAVISSILWVVGGLGYARLRRLRFR